MKARHLAIALTLLATTSGIAGTAGTASAETYSVDKAHSEASFTIRHLVSKVRGRFNDFSGTIVMDPSKPESSSVEFKIVAASIDTGTPDRDKHLRTADFFDVEKFPEITFKSTTVKKTGDTYQVTGPLAMHGVTKEVTLPVTFHGTQSDPWGNVRAGFETSIKLNRKDFGIVWNKTLDQGAVMLGEEVEVSINIEAVAKKPESKSAPAAAGTKKD